jgi:hypothetical protein
MQIINPSEELILADGWVEYVPPTIDPTDHNKAPFEIVERIVIKQWNERTDISNEEALDYMTIVYDWEHYLGQPTPAGRIVGYGGKLWRVRQEHTVLEHYAPSLDTASLYEVIEKEHTGKIDDPIPYNPPMEIFAGKYYTEQGKKYLCSRNSGAALSHNLHDLIGLYVELIV